MGSTKSNYMQSFFSQQLISFCITVGVAARNYFPITVYSRGRCTELFSQSRLQPRSRYGKTVSNDNIRTADDSTQEHTFNMDITEHHIIQLAWHNKIGFVVHFVGLCAICQCILAFVAVRLPLPLRCGGGGGGGDCVCWLCEIVVVVVVVVVCWCVLWCGVLWYVVLWCVCESWWCWCSWDLVCLCVSLYLWLFEFRNLHVECLCV